MFQLVDEKIYLGPEVGCFITHYEPAPRYGQYEGIEGWTTKINALKQAEALFERINRGEQANLGGTAALLAVKYQTGKYDALHAWEGFPDEGYRIYFDEAKLSHALIRPSGTSQCLRFHVQLKAEGLTPDNLVEKKAETLARAKAIIKDIREQIGVPT
jgi:phosphomannomutase